MTAKHTRNDWRRLGTAVQAARLRHDGWDDTNEWASVIGRSSRVLLGLERGEQTGARTLRRVEEVLSWPPGWCDRILDDSSVDRAPDVPRPLEMPLRHDPPPRPLDTYTAAQLLCELEDRFADMALELHAYGRPAVSERQEGQDTRIEPLSPEARRALLRTLATNGPVDDLSSRRERSDE